MPWHSWSCEWNWKYVMMIYIKLSYIYSAISYALNLFTHVRIVHRHNARWNHQHLSSVVVAEFYQGNMSWWFPSCKQSMDMPGWPCILWCISYLGSGGTKVYVWFPRKVQCNELVSPWRCIRTRNCLPIAQSISQIVMDSTNQSPSSLGSNWNDATSNSIEVLCLDFRWKNFQLLYLPL